MQMPEMIHPDDFPPDENAGQTALNNASRKKPPNTVCVEGRELWLLHGFLCAFDGFLRRRHGQSAREVMRAYRKVVDFYNGGGKKGNLP